MKFSDYIDVLTRRKWVVVLTMIVTVAAIIVGIVVTPPTYTASTTLQISAGAFGSEDWQEYDTLFADRVLKTYAEIATSTPVITELMMQYNLATPPVIEATPISETELLEITVQSKDPKIALDVANSLAIILIESRAMRSISPIRVEIVDPAITSAPPSLFNYVQYVIVGLVVSFIAGMGLAFTFENLDTRLLTAKQVEAVSDLKTLVEVPTVPRRRRGRLARATIAQNEATIYRLRTNMLTTVQKQSLKTIMVASSIPGEGASTIVAKLASSLGMMDQKIILVDFDLRCPVINRLFDLPNEVGLSDVLSGNKRWPDLIHDVQEHKISVLTSGPVTDNPSELLSPDRVSSLLSELEKEFDLVLLDTPAVLAVADACTLAPLVDGYLLVVGRAKLKQKDLKTTMQVLNNVSANPIGLVLNFADPSSSKRFHKYYSKRITRS